MRLFYSAFVFCLAACSSLIAQSFSLDITPKQITVRAGESADFTVHIIPHNGYSASVFVNCLEGLSASLSQTVVNPPYNNINVHVKSVPSDTGVHVVRIVGSNLNLRDTASCTVFVASNAQWTRVLSPFWSSVTFPFIDNFSGNLCVLGEIHYETKLSRYVNHSWLQTPIPNVKSLEYLTRGCYDASGKLWMSSVNGLCNYDGQFVTIYNTQNSTIPSNQVTSCDRAPNGLVYFVSGESLMSTDANANFSVLAQVQPRSSGAPSLFSIDSTGRVWYLASDNHLEFDIYPPNDTLKNSIRYRSFCSDIHVARNGTVYILDQAGVLNVVVGNTISYVTIPHSNESAEFYSISSDARGFLWIGSSEGLYQFDGVAWKLYNSALSPIQRNSIYKVICDNSNNVWIYFDSHGGLINVFNPDGLVGVPLLSTDVQSEEQAATELFSPNPANNSIRIHGEGTEELRISTLLGQLVLSQKIDCSLQPTIDLSQYPNGNFICSLGKRVTLLRIQH